MKQIPVIGLITALLTLVADQVVKAWVSGPLALPLVGQIEIMPVFRLTWAENTGVSLGLFTNDSTTGRWILIGATVLIALGVVVWMFKETARADIVSLGLVLGGATGNIVDRIRHGFVVDYADLHFGDFRPFFIFNLADAAISIGVVIILARSLLSREKHDNQTAHHAPET
jgi:signal peptidase II